MGYHDGADIPNYWTYAHDFVLQDHMFESVASWSLPSHLYMVSEWSAYCSLQADPQSCRSAIQNPQNPPDFERRLGNPIPTNPNYAWTDLTYLLHKDGVSWAYYVFKGSEPDCDNDAAMSCAPVGQSARTPGIWNPLPYFTDVQQDDQVRQHPVAHELLPGRQVGEPAGGVVGHAERDGVRAPARAGQRRPDLRDRPDQRDHATAPTGAARRSSSPGTTGAASTTTSNPPRVDDLGYGLRVPALVISPYAQARLHRPPDAQLRRVREVHRGRLPRRTAARPEDRRPPRSSARRARERARARRPPEGLRLQPGAAGAGDPASRSADRPDHAGAHRARIRRRRPRAPANAV